MRDLRVLICLCIGLLVIGFQPVAAQETVGQGVSASASVVAPAVVSGTGAQPADLQATVEQFRGLLGTNNGVGGSFPAGRREINWDAVPDGFSAPAKLPANFFNANSPRGAVFSAAPSGFQVSAKTGNPTSTPVRFGNINASYTANFSTFSPERLFTALDTSVYDVTFFIPGTAQQAMTRAFGVVFTDVERSGSAQLEFFSGATSLGVFTAPAHGSSAGLSFLGVDFGAAVVTRVHVTNGEGALGASANDLTNAGTLDLVAVDDFIYGEPSLRSVFSGAGATSADIAGIVNDFRAVLGANNGVGGSFPSGRREINWDAVPDSFSAPNNLPADFFNKNSKRGVIFATPGNGFQVSAKTGNPTATALRFGHLNGSYPAHFATFSPERLFTALDSHTTEVRFFVPDSGRPALARGFGAVFTDVEIAGTTQIEFFNGPTSLGSFEAPISSTAGFSFLAVDFGRNVVSHVRITSGQAALGAQAMDVSDWGEYDLVVMDDFIYGEPAAQPALFVPLVLR